MGPQSAGADPGPACYGKGGTLPACTDADLVLGYLDPDFFAGGKIKLDKSAAEAAIAEQIGEPLGLSTTEAAAGMYRVINTNMAQGVREITIKRGYDPREFPMVVAGGAGPLHACMICEELEIPMFLVPRESSIFCAAGMLMSDLQHDFVRSAVSVLDGIDKETLKDKVDEMLAEGRRLLSKESIPEDQWRFSLSFDCRYVKQYHEVSFQVPIEAVADGDLTGVPDAFHREHNRMYGYSLEEEGTPIELINVRLRALGITAKPSFAAESYAGADPAAARKGSRLVYLPARRELATVPVYDGHATRFGNRIEGPGIVEQVNTTLLLSSSFDCLADKYGSFLVYLKGREELIEAALREVQ
jgi:N-methylhydantoinase A